MIELLLGNFTFIENGVLIHEIKKRIWCETVSDAYKIGNEIIGNEYESFLIPNEFKGKIKKDFC